jgi:hypothetical protein
MNRPCDSALTATCRTRRGAALSAGATMAAPNSPSRPMAQYRGSASGPQHLGLLPAHSVGSSSHLFAILQSRLHPSSEPPPTIAAGLLQMAHAALPGARGPWPLDAFPGVRGSIYIAAGPKRFPGLASPTRELAGSDVMQSASVVLSLRRRRPAPDRFPWRKAPTVRRCERPNELWGNSQPRARAARGRSASAVVSAHPTTATAPATTARGVSIVLTLGPLP